MAHRITERIIRKYASALFEACNVEEYAHVESQLKELVELLNREPNLIEFIGSKTVGIAEKGELIQLISQKSGLTLKLTNLLKILAENRRIAGLSAILTHFSEYVAQFHKLLSVSVCSATEIGDDERANIESRFREIVHPLTATKFTVDSTLIGGVVVRSGDRVLDFSVKGQLDQLKRQMSLA